MKHVREGQIVWPYCSDCGCRLEMFEAKDDRFYFRHYEGFFAILGDSPMSAVMLDARGHMCSQSVWSLDDRILPQGMM